MATGVGGASGGFLGTLAASVGIPLCVKAGEALINWGAKRFGGSEDGGASTGGAHTGGAVLNRKQRAAHAMAPVRMSLAERLA